MTRLRLRPILECVTRPATLGRSTQLFLEALDRRLPEGPTGEQFATTVRETLGMRRFQVLRPGLRALAQAAWVDKCSEIKSYLKQEAKVARDLDARDARNRDVRQRIEAILEAVLREGTKGITTADVVQAFALEHGLSLLEQTIRDRYRAPRAVDREAWRKQVAQALRADLTRWPEWEPTIDLHKIELLTNSLASGFDTWRAREEPERRKATERIQALASDFEHQPRDVLVGSLHGLAWRLSRTPTEALLVTCVALSLVIGAKVGLAVTSLPIAITTVLALLGGWLAADFAGALFHWHMDNYPKGRNGFVDHHHHPGAVGLWPLRRNTQGSALPVTLLLATTVLLTRGPLAACLLALFNGALYTEHAHSYSHADEAETPFPIRVLQRIPGLPILLPPEAHLRHHRRPVGKAAYGGLNGWSNLFTDPTRFFRALEITREALTGEKPSWKKANEV
jgi:hypothetical protein